ncbi:MAG TPA: DUF2380 domain-containing protein [Gemmatimonadales bacterium]|nr:DUF2380 domain-containing protein [Gemmatimonadales bacterium]
MYKFQLSAFVAAALTVAAIAPMRPLVAQTPPPAAPLPVHFVAALDVALYTAGANLQEASDTAHAALATSVLRGTLGQLLGPALADSAIVVSRAHAPGIRETAGDRGCNVIVACARAVGRDVGAAWVVMAKLSKTSNLIWLLTGQLVEVKSGEIVMDDSTELKGDPGPMVRAGVRIFAERVARAVRERTAGGGSERSPVGESGP